MTPERLIQREVVANSEYDKDLNEPYNFLFRPSKALASMVLVR